MFPKIIKKKNSFFKISKRNSPFPNSEIKNKPKRPIKKEILETSETFPKKIKKFFKVSQNLPFRFLFPKVKHAESPT
jgi:hypothetical protein